MIKNNLLAVTLFGWLVVLTSGYATDSSEEVSVPVVPDAVKVSATEELFFTAKAQGVQIYKCQAKKDAPSQYEWVFVAPKADLFDAKGKKIGRHYAGPTWESNDGSQVVGEVKGHVPSND